MGERRHPRALAEALGVTQFLASVRVDPSVIAGTVVFIAVIAFWTWRVQFGVDLSDESFYLSLPMRFALGDRPFLDERSSVQGAGMIEVPLVWLYHLVVRDNAGLMLFMRLAYLTFLTAIGLALADAVRGWISRGSALACGAIACFYAPYSIYQMSYNTLGGGFAILAALTVLRLAQSDGTTEKSARRYAIAAGVCVACSALAYPTLIPIAGIHAVTVLLFCRRPLGWWTVLLCYAIGGGLVCLYVGLFLLRSGFGSLKLTLDFIRAWGTELTGTLEKAVLTIEQFKRDWFESFAKVGILAILARRFKPVVFVLAIYLPTIAQPFAHDDHSASMRLFTCLALFAPVFGLLVEDRKRAFQILAILWFPGVVVGILTGMSSGNSGLASGLGGFAGILAGALLACRACEEACGRWRRTFGWSSIFAPLAVLSTLWTLARAEGAIYRDSKIELLTERVQTGPFKGLRTTPEHRRVVEEMHHELVEHAKGSEYGLFFPDMPSAYLSANVRGAVAEAWPGISFKRNEINASMFREKGSRVGIVVLRACVSDFFRCYGDPSARKENPLMQAVLESHEIVARRGDYLILKPR